MPPCHRQCHGHLASAVWDGHLVSLGNAFELRKPKGVRELHAVCRLDTHRFGYELRLEVNGLMSRTQVCRSTDEVLDLSEQWRAAMLEKGGRNDAAPTVHAVPFGLRLMKTRFKMRRL